MWVPIQRTIVNWCLCWGPPTLGKLRYVGFAYKGLIRAPEDCNEQYLLVCVRRWWMHTQGLGIRYTKAIKKWEGGLQFSNLFRKGSSLVRAHRVW